MSLFWDTTLLMFILLNPFLIILYLVDLVKRKDYKVFAKRLWVSGCITSLVFTFFVITGEFFFTKIIQAQFYSFQIFGGITFLLIALQIVFKGNDAIGLLRADSENVSASIAMPIMIGPGTISVSVVAGKRLGPVLGTLSIVTALLLSILIMIGLKVINDVVSKKNEKVVEQYMEIAGKILSIVAGTFSVQMIINGIKEAISK